LDLAVSLLFGEQQVIDQLLERALSGLGEVVGTSEIARNAERILGPSRDPPPR
jgi:hypothetical protein